MKIIFLALIFLNISDKLLIECSCIVNNLSTSNTNEPIVGKSFASYYLLICLSKLQDGYKLCIRTIDDTGNYSPYLHYKQDDNSFFNAAEFYQQKTLKNVKNNLYLATLLNGFVYFSNQRNIYSEWELIKAHIQLFTDYHYTLYSNNYFNLYSTGGASAFDIINVEDYTSDVKICFYKKQDFCIRTIDNTGNNSPYLSPIKDENIYFKYSKYTGDSTSNNKNYYTFRNKINNLYLASLPNGFIYYSPSIEPNSKWYIDTDYSDYIINHPILIKNYGNDLKLISNNLYTLEVVKDSFSFDFVIADK